MGKKLKVSAWNAHNARPDILRAYVKDCLKDGAVAIVLTEVWTRHGHLRIIAQDLGLVMHAETPGNRRLKVVPEHGDTVILTAPEFKVESFNVVEMGLRWWVYSAKRLHEPRRLLRVVGTVNGQRVEIIGAHGPTGGNVAAVAEFKTAVTDLLTKTRPDTTTVVAGDFNVRLPDAKPWAKANRLSVSGWGPDLALTNGRTRSRRRGKRGSDHYAMKHTITPRKKRP